MKHYRLNKDGSIETCTLTEWAETYPRFQQVTIVNGVCVSTVFLGLDHNYTDEGAPILFETMTFTKRRQSFKRFDQLQWRYCDLENAEAHHRAIVKAIKHKRFNTPEIK